jgi:hypothetical protein
MNDVSSTNLRRLQRFLKNERVLIASIFFLALAIRMIWALFFTPYPTMGVGFQDDEKTYVSAAHRFISWVANGKLILTDDLQANYGHFLFAKMLFALAIQTCRFLPDIFAVRLFNSLIGSFGTLAMYYLGKRLFRTRSMATALAISFSFSPVYFIITTVAILDGVAATFIVISYFFLLRYNFSSSVDTNLVICSVFLGLALASKVLAVTGAVAILAFVLSQRRTQTSRKLLTLLVLIAISTAVFFIVQPRLWFDPLKRLDETIVGNEKHLIMGHPIPANSLPGGDASWIGPRVLPPWWTIIYWVFSTSSPIQVAGLFLLGYSWRMIVVNRNGTAVRLSLLAFSIPLLYFSIQNIKLPQYLAFVAPGLALTAFLGFKDAPRSVTKSIVPLSIAAIVNPIEMIGFHAQDANFGILYPIWQRFIEWILSFFIIALTALHHVRSKRRQQVWSQSAPM